MLLDSNIVVYVFQVPYAELRQQVIAQNPAVSAISYVEVMGYHRLTAEDRRDFEEFFAGTLIIPLDPAVLDRAVQLRQVRKIGLGDSLVAATALVSGRRLFTRNVSDFAWIDGLEVVNPFPDGGR